MQCMKWDEKDLNAEKTSGEKMVDTTKKEDKHWIGREGN